MKITPQTNVLEMIKAHPELVDVLIKYNEHFKLLKNPIMKKTFARLATVKHAAKAAGVNLPDMIKVLNNAIGETVSDNDIDSVTADTEPLIRVKALVEEKHAKVYKLDVRELMRTGGEPFNQIMQTVAKVKNGEAFLLETIFEPAPLYDMLKKKGFIHETEMPGSGHYKIWFYKIEKAERHEETQDTKKRVWTEDGTVYIDVKGLEPPQPMALVLETLAKTEAHKTVIVFHERKPVFLLPKLEEKGYKYEIQEFSEHDVRIIIHNPE